MNKPNNLYNCYQKYINEFQDDWIEKLDWQSRTAAEDSLRKGEKKISDFHRTCFVLFTKSLLGGEYIIFKPDYDKIKYDFEQYCIQEYYCPENDKTNKEAVDIKAKLYNRYNALNNSIRDMFLEYSSFIIAVNEKIDYINHKYIYRAKSLSYSEKFHYFEIMKDIVFPLCTSEHYLSYSKGLIRNIAILLEETKRLINNETYEECKSIFTLIKYKATFILKKLLTNEDSFDTLKDGVKNEVTRNNLPTIPIELNLFFSYFENIHEDKPYSLKEMNSFQIKISAGNGTFLQMACLMHYYCSITRSKQQIKNLLTIYNNKYNIEYKTAKYDFDKYALSSLRNFMYNCQLSYKIKQYGYSIPELEKDMEVIAGLQDETFIKNFYPYKKAIEFLIKELSTKLKDRDTKFNYEYGISLLDKYFYKFDDNVNWCYTHYFYPVQLMANDCIIKTEEGEIILPSSISRPVDYTKLQNEREKYRSEIEHIKNSLIYIKDKKDTDSIKEELHNIEKRYLEIGGVLIGIVTFLFGSINTFIQNSSELSALLNSTLNFGIILVIFSTLLIIVIEQWKGSPNKWRLGICILIFITYTIILICKTI